MHITDQVGINEVREMIEHHELTPIGRMLKKLETILKAEQVARETLGQTGFKWVPTRPSPRMLDALNTRSRCECGEWVRSSVDDDNYAAMLSVLPRLDSGVPAGLHQQIAYAVECLESTYVQSNLARMGALGASDVQHALLMLRQAIGAEPHQGATGGSPQADRLQARRVAR